MQEHNCTLFKHWNLFNGSIISGNGILISAGGRSYAIEVSGKVGISIAGA